MPLLVGACGRQKVSTSWYMAGRLCSSSLARCRAQGLCLQNQTQRDLQFTARRRCCLAGGGGAPHTPGQVGEQHAARVGEDFTWVQDAERDEVHRACHRRQDEQTPGWAAVVSGSALGEGRLPRSSICTAKLSSKARLMSAATASLTSGGCGSCCKAPRRHTLSRGPHGKLQPGSQRDLDHVDEGVDEAAVGVEEGVLLLRTEATWSHRIASPRGRIATWSTYRRHRDPKDTLDGPASDVGTYVHREEGQQLFHLGGHGPDERVRSIRCVLDGVVRQLAMQR